MKTKYLWTNRLMILLGCLALITWGLHIYANWKISIPFLHAHSALPRREIILGVLRIFWISSIPIFLFFILTAIAGFWRKRIYLPLFFILFFWLGGLRELKAVIEYWGWTTSFYLPSKLLAWSSLLMFFCAIAATISWVIELFLQSKNKG